jgi:flagellar FliJ protein
MTFQFRFESLLQLRRRERDEAGASVGQATEAILKIDDQIQEVEQLREELKQQQGDIRTGSISVDRMLSVGRYDLQLQADVVALLDTKEKLNQEFLRRQSLLAEAQSEVGRYEKLEERAKEDYRTEQLKREQAEADDRSSSAFLMKTRRLDQKDPEVTEQVRSGFQN